MNHNLSTSGIKGERWPSVCDVHLPQGHCIEKEGHVGLLPRANAIQGPANGGNLPCGRILSQIPMPFCGGLSLVKIAPEPQRHAPQNFFARAAGRYMPIRARDGTRESYTHTYLTNASLGP